MRTAKEPKFVTEEGWVWSVKSKIGHVQFLLDFIQRDLESLRPGERIDLFEDLEDIALVGMLGLKLKGLKSRLSLREAKALQRELGESFRAVRERGERTIKGLSIDRVVFTSPKRRHGQAAMRREVRSRYQGRTVRSGFLMHAWDILQTFDFGRIQDCRRCGRAFLARKGGLYCSPACSQRERADKYQERHKAELSELRHAAYERRMRKLRGPGYEAKRRPRTRQA
jgi:hypothetical protein